MFWSDWATKDAKYRLPFIYNVIPNVAYGYRPAYLKFHSNIKIIHFIGPVKPWQHQSSFEGGHEYVKRWWDVWNSIESLHPLPEETAGNIPANPFEEQDVVKTAAEQRAIIAELRPQLEARASKQIQEAKERARQAEENLALAEQQAQDKLQEAERRVQEGLWREERQESQRKVAQQRCKEAEESLKKVKEDLEEAKQRLTDAKQRLEESKNHWTVQSDDIEITDDELGKRDWGVVKIANFCGTRVAAKCYHKELSPWYHRKMFEHEMNMAAHLRHPNLVQFIGATVENKPIILLELMTKSLRAMLQSGPITQHQVTSICVDVAQALNYLHKMKPQAVIHHNLSSTSVLLDPLPGNQWRAKISYCGSVNVMKQLQMAGPRNPVYAAPEAENPQKQSPKIDIFSFGVLMSEILTGKLPVPEVEIHHHLRESVQHTGYVALIKLCLDQDTKRRPSAETLLSQLKDY